MKIILILFLLVLGGGAAWWFGVHNAETPTKYRTAKVERGDLRISVASTGTVQPFLLVQVGTQVTGTIQKLMVDFNSKVKTHQVIATLDPAFYEAQVQSAEADLENANANAALQKITLARDASLLAKNLLSQSD